MVQEIEQLRASIAHIEAMRAQITRLVEEAEEGIEWSEAIYARCWQAWRVLPTRQPSPQSKSRAAPGSGLVRVRGAAQFVHPLPDRSVGLSAFDGSPLIR